MRNAIRIVLICTALVASAHQSEVALSAAAGADSNPGGKITIALVTNGIDPFWTIAEKGARDAAADPKTNVNVEVRMPAQGLVDQEQIVGELLATGVKGIAICPINPESQGKLLDEIAAKARLITFDTDQLQPGHSGLHSRSPTAPFPERPFRA
jgi:ABC-type sugar transport system substrate-binding protein